MDDRNRLHWVDTHILPLEGEVRGWLGAHARTLDAADVDDIVQEAFARIWTANLAQITNPRAYFYTVVRHLLAERARHARVVPMERMGEIESLRIICGEPGPERRVSARQELTRLLKLVAELPRQCRRAFELRKFDGLPQREIARMMNISEKTVEKHLAKALLRVMHAMADDTNSLDSKRPAAIRHDPERKRD